MTGPQRILLLGGGHARPPLLKRLSALSRRGHRVTLLAPAPQIWAEAVPALLAGRIDPGTVRLDAGTLAQQAGIGFIDDGVLGLDLKVGLVHRHEGEPVPFDLLSIAPDAATRPLAGTAGHGRCFATRPLSRLLDLRAALEARFEQHPGRVVALTIAGGGTEAIGAAIAIIALAARLGGHVAVTVLARGRLLTGLPERAGVRLLENLSAHGAILQEMAPVARVDGNEAVLTGGDRIAFDLFLNATGVAGPSWLKTSGLDVDADGRLRCDDKLFVGGLDHVLAVGEATCPAGGRHPGWDMLAYNLSALITGLVPRKSPRHRPPLFIDLGNGTALAHWAGRWTLGRSALWALRWAEGRWLL
ncbi:FAD-dependent oxidoreductase [Niveispirillum sp.]|uniref:NAD(P)/FAD-dependent oxidoreductase n=1 Tax=Niveispirillum sp. TaxID=1917217 RepID=UPI001B60E41F|nr:FAD-dependent oxidoreductase [Niveispirillum sp.]MBP7339452.1 FAD-dependent oxidoreductase [Niveispirillum sp.]